MGAGAQRSGSANRWKTVAAALADARRLDLYARIVTGAGAGLPLHGNALAGKDARSLAVLEKAGLVSVDGDGTLHADAKVFADLLASGRESVPSSPLRLLAPGRGGGLPGKRPERLEVLHHLAGEVFSRHGELAAGARSGTETGAGSLAAGTSRAGREGLAQLTEAEVTSRLGEYVEDPAMVRRAMVDEDIVRRSADGSRYWLAQPRPADGMEFA